MSDLISRQVAIELIHTMYPSAPIMRMNRKKWKKKYKPYIESEKALERLPSAQIEREKGKWINITNDESLEEEYECSVCGYELFYSKPTNFCPDCGADMMEKTGGTK